MSAFNSEKWNGLGMSETDRTRFELYALSWAITLKSKSTPQPQKASESTQKVKPAQR